MDWEKVVKALDDEWDNHRSLAERRTDPDECKRHRALADIAFMLRDCLQRGLKP
jgi:hypothetical protein